MPGRGRGGAGGLAVRGSRGRAADVNLSLFARTGSCERATVTGLRAGWSSLELLATSDEPLPWTPRLSSVRLRWHPASPARLPEPSRFIFRRLGQGSGSASRDAIGERLPLGGMTVHCCAAPLHPRAVSPRAGGGQPPWRPTPSDTPHQKETVSSGVCTQGSPPPHPWVLPGRPMHGLCPFGALPSSDVVRRF